MEHPDLQRKRNEQSETLLNTGRNMPKEYNPAKAIEANKKYFKSNVQENERFGCCVFTPSWIQFCNKIQWNVFWQCIFNFFEGFIVNGVINVIIPALEKRYEMSSKKSALIASGNDFGALVFLLFVGYFGEKRHKPKIMAFGVFLMSFGSLVFALPHFIGDTYKYTISDGSSNTSENLCSRGSINNQTSCDTSDTDASSYSGYYAMFIIGQVLLGIGAAPMFTIALSYIDENCKQKMTSFYVALTFCFAAIGVAVGYIVGGQSLSIYVDIDKVDPSTVPLTPQDPQWTGAWWIGIILTCVAFVIISLPLLAYPKRLPGYDELQKHRKSETHTTSEEQTQPNLGNSWKEFPRALWTLMKNPAFTFTVLGATVELLVIAGLASFGAKLITIFFNVDLTTAGYVMGILTIPGSGGGMIMGGYLVKRLDLKCRGIIRMCFICMSCCLLFAPAFLASCPSRPAVGVSRQYLYNPQSGLDSECNHGCQCSTNGYEPICDQQKQVYFNPCYAGCINVTVNNGEKSYSDCSCINTTMADGGREFDANYGSCSEKCTWFYVFCVLLFFLLFLTFMTMSPVVTVIFRCVPYEQRSFALGIQLMVGRLLGTTPGPVLLGSIIDSTCDVWQSSCGITGSCWIYRKFDLGLRIMLWWLALKVVGVICFFTASKLYKPPTKTSNGHQIEVIGTYSQKKSDVDEKTYL